MSNVKCPMSNVNAATKPSLCSGCAALAHIRSTRSSPQSSCLQGNPRRMIMLGGQTNMIEYNDTSSQWVLTDAKSDVKSCVSSLEELPSPWQTQSGQSQMMTASANFRSTQLRYILKALFKDTSLAYRFAMKFREA